MKPQAAEVLDAVREESVRNPADHAPMARRASNGNVQRTPSLRRKTKSSIAIKNGKITKIQLRRGSTDVSVPHSVSAESLDAVAAGSARNHAKLKSSRDTISTIKKSGRIVTLIQIYSGSPRKSTAKPKEVSTEVIDSVPTTVDPCISTSKTKFGHVTKICLPVLPKQVAKPTVTKYVGLNDGAVPQSNNPTVELQQESANNQRSDKTKVLPVEQESEMLSSSNSVCVEKPKAVSQGLNHPNQRGQVSESHFNEQILQKKNETVVFTEPPLSAALEHSIVSKNRQNATCLFNENPDLRYDNKENSACRKSETSKSLQKSKAVNRGRPADVPFTEHTLRNTSGQDAGCSNKPNTKSTNEIRPIDQDEQNPSTLQGNRSSHQENTHSRANYLNKTKFSQHMYLECHQEYTIGFDQNRPGWIKAEMATSKKPQLIYQHRRKPGCHKATSPYHSKPPCVNPPEVDSPGQEEVSSTTHSKSGLPEQYEGAEEKHNAIGSCYNKEPVLKQKTESICPSPFETTSSQSNKEGNQKHDSHHGNELTLMAQSQAIIKNLRNPDVDAAPLGNPQISSTVAVSGQLQRAEETKTVSWPSTTTQQEKSISTLEDGELQCPPKVSRMISFFQQIISNTAQQTVPGHTSRRSKSAPPTTRSINGNTIPPIKQEAHYSNSNQAQSTSVPSQTSLFFNQRPMNSQKDHSSEMTTANTSDIGDLNTYLAYGKADLIHSLSDRINQSQKDKISLSLIDTDDKPHGTLESPADLLSNAERGARPKERSRLPPKVPPKPRAKDRVPSNDLPHSIPFQTSEELRPRSTPRTHVQHTITAKPGHRSQNHSKRPQSSPPSKATKRPAPNTHPDSFSDKCIITVDKKVTVVNGEEDGSTTASSAGNYPSPSASAPSASATTPQFRTCSSQSEASAYSVQLGENGSLEHLENLARSIDPQQQTSSATEPRIVSNQNISTTYHVHVYADNVVVQGNMAMNVPIKNDDGNQDGSTEDETDDTHHCKCCSKRRKKEKENKDWRTSAVSRSKSL